MQYTIDESLRFLDVPRDILAEYGARTAGKRAAAIDAFVGMRIQNAHPMLHWLFKYKIFRNRFVARAIGLRIESRRMIHERSTSIRIFCFGKAIGTLQILEHDRL